VTSPSTLPFVDVASPEPVAAAELAAAAFGWLVEPRPADVFSTGA
jgi:hypothetical protein